MRWLRDQGLTVRFTTNTDATAPAARADRLAGAASNLLHLALR
jgi:hypothetical protein